jgi:acetyl esterase/lipase
MKATRVLSAVVVLAGVDDFQHVRTQTPEYPPDVVALIRDRVRNGAAVVLDRDRRRQRAMRVIRANAVRWKIDARTLAVVGFSAGGHLAATLSTGFAEPVYVPVDGADAASARPFAAALVYPVVTMAVPGTHPVSRELLLGPNPLPSQVARRSAELHVGAETPPLLLVHALDDTAVPVSNSLNLLTAMRAADRPVEAHLFHEGGHAFASGYPSSPTSSWIAVFDAWLARLRASS